MASLANSPSSSSSSSYRSARYSSSSFRAGSSGGQDPLFEPYLDGGPCSLFGEEGAGTPLCHLPFSRHRSESFGYPGGTGTSVAGRPASMGVVRRVGDSYHMSADVSQFEPQDVVVMAYSHWVVIHAEKVADDGSVSDTFTHKSQLPEDMDPLSVSSTLTPEGMLVVSVRRKCSLESSEPARPAYCSEARL
ncbi:heat shock protein beta-7-like [Megalops cyprinoides]|uniref:heat shock protein beta-7-like n=1 Tax=Megalops cyprinoides TaxID=118141 RepID=UPI0018653EF6|nr:heat shock protein beta-7-like [Megalops cyprinoides]